MEELKLSPPWQTFYKEVCALFNQDADVIPVYNDSKKELKLLVSKYEKAKALEKLIPKKKEFGNITIDIKVEYKEKEQTVAELFETAFENNAAFKNVFTFDIGTNNVTYVTFTKEVVQYWNDDMSDPHGITSTLYQNIAEDVFKIKGVMFSTDSEKNNKWTERYYEKHATPEEIELWEHYNGTNSYHEKCGVKENKSKPIPVTNKETFKSVFDYKEEIPFEEYPF